MLRVRLFIVSTFLVVLYGCGEWPPNISDANKVFQENRESFDRLSEKMRETDYWRISRMVDTSVEVTPSLDGPEPNFTIDDDAEWHELLVTVRMVMVLQSDDGTVWTSPGVFWGWRDNQLGSSGYSHIPVLGDDYVHCKPEFKDIECGRCVVALEDDWYVHYHWYPEYFSKDDWESLLNDDISWDQYSEPYYEALEQCTVEGFSEMGYDVSKIFDQGEG